MKRMLQIVAAAVLLATIMAGVLLWQTQSLEQQVLRFDGATVDYTVERGSNARQVLHDFQQKGWLASSPLWRVWLRLQPEHAAIQAGHYRLNHGDSVRRVLAKMVAGEVVRYSVTFVEGWSIREVREALRKAESLRQTLPSLSNEELMRALGRPAVHPEGQFFPSTYVYTDGMTDQDVLKQAMRMMDEQLADAWAKRSPGLPFSSPYEALIMASIVEKETGHASDRHDIAGVFVRRLQQRMRLQTDPTVIYGLGDRFDGNLRKIDLQTDTPYNSYTRAGLPPTPICMPGAAALDAALHPAAGDALYFVARGDGTTVFSATLEQHNAAVREFQLKRSRRGR